MRSMLLLGAAMGLLSLGAPQARPFDALALSGLCSSEAQGSSGARPAAKTARILPGYGKQPGNGIVYRQTEGSRGNFLPGFQQFQHGEGSGQLTVSGTEHRRHNRMFIDTLVGGTEDDFCQWTQAAF